MPATDCVYIFGDSISYGEWDSLGGWVSRLRYAFDRENLSTPENYTLVYNLGIPSDTSSGVLSRFDNEIRSRANCQNAKLKNHIIIAIGTNDSGQVKTKQQPRCILKEFTQNIKQLIAKANNYKADLYFIGLAPCNEKAVFKASNRFDWLETYNNENILRYDQVVKQLCYENQITFIDINLAFNLHCKENLYCPDGLHPNDKGHELIFNQVMESIKLN